VGYISRGRGIIYHHRDCTNIINMQDSDRLVPVSWGKESLATYPVPVRVSALDRVGLLKDMRPRSESTSSRC
jgi:GTP pyrophosphokinase